MADPAPWPLRLENWEYDPLLGRLVANFVSADHGNPATHQRFRFVVTHAALDPLTTGPPHSTAAHDDAQPGETGARSRP